VVSVTNNLDSTRSQNFTYDQLNRIKTAQTQSTTGGNCWGLSFTYDNWANLTAASVTQCTAPMLSIAVDTKNRINTAGFSYDLAGNVTADGSFSYAWNAESEMKTAAGVTYTYDGLGNRVKKSNGKLYWYGMGSAVLDESDLSGNFTNEYVYFGGQRFARRDASGNVYYYVEDMLGTSRVITQANGTVCYDADFYPFGGERTPIVNTCPQNFKFTGYERDAESGNDYARARFYNPRLGRFMSGDPLAGDSAGPQSLNRYGYVLNSPTALIDPSGMLHTPMNFWEGNFPGIFDDLAGGGAGCDEFDAIDPNSFCSQFVTPESDPTWSAFGWEFTGTINGQYYDHVPFDTWDGYANWRTTVAAAGTDPCVFSQYGKDGNYTGKYTVDTTLNQSKCNEKGGQWVPEGEKISVGPDGKVVRPSTFISRSRHSPCLWADIGALVVDAFTLVQPELTPWAVSASAHAVACNALWEYNP
jgi:RHS repeat-associated protein